MSENWKKVVIRPDATMREALSVIDAGALRIALVADEAGALLGTVTDGDIRRALIRGCAMDETVGKLMNQSPTVSGPSAQNEELITLMETKALLAVPLVDDGVLVGLRTLQDLTGPVSRENPVFLMAGGFGTRLRPLTENCPKPMLKVGDKPILETTLLNFISAGFRNFFISTHYMPELIRDHFGTGEKWDVSITYVHEDEPLGTGGALGLLPENCPELPLIMMNGDVLTNVDFGKLLAFHEAENAEATMCVREYEHQVPFGVIEVVDGRIVSMVEKPVQRFHMNAGIYVVSPRAVANVCKNQRLDMPTLLEKQIAQNRKVMMFPMHEYWLDIGRIGDFNQAQEDIAELGLFN